MAGFNTLDDLISELALDKHWLEIYLKNNPNIVGVANTWQSTWTFPGNPQAGGHTGTALGAAQCDNTTTGAIYTGGNVLPDIKRLTKFGLQCGVVSSGVAECSFLLYDRLLYYPGINAAITTVQTLTNGLGLPRYTTGRNVRAFLEVTTALGAGTGEVAIGYTDNNGDPTTVTVNTVASTAATRIPHSGAVAGLWGSNGSFYNPFLPIRADETESGLINCTSIQFTSAHASGVVALVLGAPIARITLPDVNTYIEREFVYGFPPQPRIFDGACLGLLFCPTSTASAIAPYLGDLEFAWG